MLKTITQFSEYGNARSIPEWDRMTNELDTKFNYFKSKLRSAPVNFSPGINLIYALTFNVDLDYILNMTDDYEIYSEYIKPAVPMISKLIDPIISTARTEEIFVNGVVNDNPTELIIPIYRNRPMLELPFGQGWESWKNVKCIRVLDHDSLELVSDLLNQKINFNSDRPSHLVIGVDIATLLMLFIKYLQRFKNNISLGEFAKNHIFTSLYSDLHVIWMMNIINKRITNTLDTKALISTYNTSGIVTPSAIRDGIKVLDDNIEKVKQGSIPPEDFLMTKWLNGVSIIDYSKELISKNIVPEVRQYKYQQLYIEFKCTILCLNLYNLYPKSRTFKRLNIKLAPVLRDLEKNNISDLTRPMSLKHNTSQMLEKIMAVVTR